MPNSFLRRSAEAPFGLSTALLRKVFAVLSQLPEEDSNIAVGPRPVRPVLSLQTALGSGLHRTLQELSCLPVPFFPFGLLLFTRFSLSLRAFLTSRRTQESSSFTDFLISPFPRTCCMFLHFPVVVRSKIVFFLFLFGRLPEYPLVPFGFLFSVLLKICSRRIETEGEESLFALSPFSIFLLVFFPAFFWLPT